MADVLDGKRWRVDQADVLEWLGSLPADCADLLVCSPPYESCRLYLEDGRDLGIARDTEEWVAWMVAVCHAARRVVKGLCALVVEGRTQDYRYSCSPFLLMAHLHRQGFDLRKPPIYRRVGSAGSGGPDWLRNDYEPVVCFARGGKLPWSDNTACGHPPKWAPGGEMSHRLTDGTRVNQWGGHPGSGSQRRSSGVRQKPGRPSHRLHQPNGSKEEQYYNPPVLANPGNVIDCKVGGGGQMGNPICHQNEAPFPEALAEFFVRSFCPPGGLVLDPFCGSGTTGAVAVRWSRRFLGCDLRQSQVELSRRRIAGETPDLFAGADTTPGNPGNSEVVSAPPGETEGEDG